MSRNTRISVEEVSKHSTDQDCWLVIDNEIWDLTEFAPQHPGGAAIILKYGGRDATEPYNEIHAPSIIRDTLNPSKHIGSVDKSTITPEWQRPPPQATKQLQRHEKPPLYSIINTFDFETIASETAPAKTWAFYSSAATDLITRDLNRSLYNRIFFRPRVMRDVSQVDTTTTILGQSVSSPFMVAPAAMVKLIHPEGEKGIATACASKGIIQCISTNSSFPLTEICSEVPDHPFFFQLYVNKDRPKSEALLQQINSLPNVKAIFVTCDAAMAGKREGDERVKADESVGVAMTDSKAKNDKKGGSYGRLMGGYIDNKLNWNDIAWLRKNTKLPLVLKGIMTAADAKLAAEYGLDGILLSNHGGRNLDTSPPAIITLLEIHKLFPEVLDQLEIFVDGGVRRGTDILKALCLGAKGVFLGRPFLFAAGYGQEGVEHLIDSTFTLPSPMPLTHNPPTPFPLSLKPHPQLKLK
ncbi:putative mitochondrial cytochrome b2 [Phaeomoniella chlamydospora]|uniref:L-lactate dehydrogenase (cytochrome) n=1 Tax=Phaeomoniella chlamydospora TaxID=158046 RepID=A0A0G2ENK4_PHACM|nr:putative mitochondrial cytochrome b2 [Phaeomoniella chlamydospora]